MSLFLFALATACAGNVQQELNVEKQPELTGANVPTSGGLACPTPTNACMVGGGYNAATQACNELRPAADATPCDDQNACTSNDTCNKGTCVAGEVVQCTSNDKCKTASCDPTAGCQMKVTDPLCNSTLVAEPMQGCWLSTYSFPLTIGNATFGMLLSTGSDVTAVAGNECTTCSGVTPTYDFSADPTASVFDAGTVIRQPYVNGTLWDGTGVTAKVNADAAIGPVSMNLADISDTNTTTQHQFFDDQDCDLNPATYIQGIVGAGFGQGLVGGLSSFMDSMASVHKAPDAFSVHFCDRSGYLWFGGYDPGHTAAPAQYVGMTNTMNKYIVSLSGVSVGGVSVPTQPVQAIVETASSTLVLPQAIFQQAVASIDQNPNFLQYFPAGMMATPLTCSALLQSATRQTLDNTLPHLVLQLTDAQGGKVTLDLPATRSYLMSIGEDSTLQYCAALTSGSSTVLGVPAMLSHVVIFDRANMRMGFAPQQGCP